MSVPKICFAIGHPFDLAYFQCLVKALENFGFVAEYRAVVACMGYFKTMLDLDNRLKFVSEYLLVSEREMPHYGRDLIRNLSMAFRLIARVRGANWHDSVLISNDKSTFFSSILLANFDRKILLQDPPLKGIERDYRFDWYRTVGRGVYNALTGAKHSVVYRNRVADRQIWHCAIVRNDSPVIYRTPRRDIANVSLPPVATGGGNKLVIFGSRYKGWQCFEQDRHGAEAVIHDVYRAVFARFQGLEWIYKPHPLESGKEFDEINRLAGGRLVWVGNSRNAELFLMENPDIDYCFSLGSTASRSAYDMGFSSRCFLKMLPMAPSVRAAYMSIFSDMPAAFFIDSAHDDVETPCVKSDFSYNLNCFVDSIMKLSPGSGR